MPPFPGSELTKEPFRWDQRVFSLILRIPGYAPPLVSSFNVDQRVPADFSPVNVMCEVTGGTWWNGADPHFQTISFRAFLLHHKSQGP